MCIRDSYTTAKDLEHAGMGITIIETLADSLEIESVINIGTKLILSLIHIFFRYLIGSYVRKS